MQFQYETFDTLDTQTLYDILSHRFEVFVLEQHCIYHDYDAFDKTGIRLIARREDGTVVGYCRLIPAQQHYEGYDEHSFGDMRLLSLRTSERSLPVSHRAGRAPGRKDLRHGLSGKILQ